MLGHTEEGGGGVERRVSEVRGGCVCDGDVITRTQH